MERRFSPNTNAHIRIKLLSIKLQKQLSGEIVIHSANGPEELEVLPMGTRKHFWMMDKSIILVVVIVSWMYIQVKIYELKTLYICTVLFVSITPQYINPLKVSLFSYYNNLGKHSTQQLLIISVLSKVILYILKQYNIVQNNLQDKPLKSFTKSNNTGLVFSGANRRCRYSNDGTPILLKKARLMTTAQQRTMGCAWCILTCQDTK